MTQVDDFQAGAEWADQQDDERRAAEREQTESDLAAEPIKLTGRRPRRFELVRVGDVTAGANIRIDSPDVHGMAVSLLQRGQIQPIGLIENGDLESPYLLAFGRRRLEGFRLLAERGEEFPIMAIVFGLLPDETAIPAEELEELQLLENVAREQMSPKNVGRVLRRFIVNNPDLTAGEVAQSFGKVGETGREWARSHMRLIEGLPDAVIKLVDAGNLSFRAADVLRKGVARGDLDATDASEIADLAAAEGATGQDLAQMLDPHGNPTNRPPPAPDGYQERADALDAARIQGAKDKVERAGDESYDKPDPVLDDWGAPAKTLKSDAEPGIPIPDDLPSATEAAENATADSYLLGFLLREHAGDTHLETLGVERTRTFSYAEGLPAAARLKQIRSLSRSLSASDALAPTHLRALTGTA